MTILLCRFASETKSETTRVKCNLDKLRSSFLRPSEARRTYLKPSLTPNLRDLITIWVLTCSEAQDTEEFPKIKTSGRWWLWLIKRRSISEQSKTNLMLLDTTITSPLSLKDWVPRPTSSTPQAKSKPLSLIMILTAKKTRVLRTILLVTTPSAPMITNCFSKLMSLRTKECTKTRTLTCNWLKTSRWITCTLLK